MTATSFRSAAKLIPSARTGCDGRLGMFAATHGHAPLSRMGQPGNQDQFLGKNFEQILSA